MTKQDPDESFTALQLDAGADALRRFEMAGRVLRDWDKISIGQRRKWQEKANAVLQAVEGVR